MKYLNVISILSLSLAGCVQAPVAQPQQQVQNPVLERIQMQRSFPVLEFVAMQGSTLNRNSVLTIAPMQSDVGNFSSSLELALAQKYKVISSISNTRASTTIQSGETTTTRNDVTYTKATHVIRITYSGVREIDQYYATSFNAQFVRISDGSIDGVIRRHPQGRFLFSGQDLANRAFDDAVLKMP
jgi:hypothetical protein